MLKLNRLMVGVLISVLILTGCHKKDGTMDTQGQQESAVVTEELTGAPAADTGTKQAATETAGENVLTKDTKATNELKDAEYVVTKREEELETEHKASAETGQEGAAETEHKASVKTETSDAAETEGEQMEVIGDDITKEFYYKELPEDVIDRIQGKSYKDNCDVPYSELRYVRVLYQGFDEETHRGELIVNKAIAEDIVEIFRELYDLKYPIERMVLVDEYEADDNTSMAADNTSCFNYRNVDGTKHLSLHSYGLAIDINPRYNPYVRKLDGKELVTPENGVKYADRSLKCQYYIDTEDACYKAFTEHGFTWGGEWVNSKDYQHFQKELDE